VTVAIEPVLRSSQSASIRQRIPIAAVCHRLCVGAAMVAGDPGVPIGIGAALSRCTVGSSEMLKRKRRGVDRDDLVGGQCRRRAHRQRGLRQYGDRCRLYRVGNDHRPRRRADRTEQFLDIAEQRIGAAAGGRGQQRHAIAQGVNSPENPRQINGVRLVCSHLCRDPMSISMRKETWGHIDAYRARRRASLPVAGRAQQHNHDPEVSASVARR
jgi:hypothetical protein